jgi:3-oxoadipate enol-lactonase
VAVEGRPAAPAVLLSHSLGSNLSIWDSLAAELAADFRVVRYDSRGHGQSDAPAGPYSNAMLGADALSILDALRIEHAAFVGLSKGAMTGMWLAVEAPESIDALVLANTTTFIPNKTMWDEAIARAQSEGLEGIGRETIERWLGGSFRAAQPDEVERHVAVMQTMPVEGYAGSCALLRDVDLRDRLQHIGQPTLVIGGADDLPVAVEGARAMARVIAGAELVVIPDAAHLSPIENGPVFNAAVTDFLRKTLG